MTHVSLITMSTSGKYLQRNCTSPLEKLSYQILGKVPRQIASAHG